MKQITKINWDIGNGLKFDKVNDYVTLGNVLNYTNQDFTFSFQLKLLSLSNNQYFIGNITDSPSTGGFALVYVNGGTTRYITTVFSNGSSFTYSFDSYPFQINTLYNITFIRYLTNIKIYINNILLTTLTNRTNTSTIKPMIIGAYPETAQIIYFGGIMYDVKVFNKELSQAEVTELYLKQGQIVPSTAISSLQLDIRFNDKSGTVAKDQSTNGYNGTLVNYAAGTTNLGATNMWVDKYQNPILQY